MKISIIGSGAVGSRIGKTFAKLENDVIFYDVSDRALESLSDQRFKTTNDLGYALKNSDVSFVAVPTPTEYGRFNPKFIKKVAEDCGKEIKDEGKYHIFVLKSTVVPGTTEKIFIPGLEETSNKKVDEGFGVVYSPEFLTVIHNTWTVDKDFIKTPETEDKIVFGEGHNKTTGDTIEYLFKPFDRPIIRTDYKTAEMIKYASNCALASRISYWNEIYFICRELGIESDVVAEISGMDNRIGKYGTIHKKAFGGPCLPKDLEAFIGFIEENIEHDPIYLKAVRDINENIKNINGVRE